MISMLKCYRLPIKEQVPGYPGLRLGKKWFRPNDEECRDSGNLRRVWRETQIPPPNREFLAHSTNPHKHLAEERYRAHKMLYDVIQKCGKVPYEISASRRSESVRPGGGYHAVFTHRDRAYPQRNEPIEENAVMVCVDVDYYMSDEALAHSGRPIMMYTFNPVAYNGETAESCWNTDPDGTVCYQVRGGGTYRHRMRDYTALDSATIALPSGNKRVYSVDWQRVSPTHIVVLLTPDVLIRVNDWFNEEEDIVPEFQWRVMRDGFQACGETIRIHLDGRSVDVPADAHAQVAWRLESAKKDFGIGAIHQQLTAHGCGEKALMAAGAYYKLRQQDELPLPQVLNYTRFALDKRGLPIVEEIDDMRGTHAAVANPPTPAPVFAPLASTGNAIAAVVERIHEVLQAPDPDFPIESLAKEFVVMCLLFADVRNNSVVPLSYDELAACISRPKTRARIEHVAATSAISSVLSVTAFMKREAYGEVRAPRNISATDDEHLANLGVWTYAVKKNVLNKLHFYFPGHGPKEIAEQLAAFVNMSTEPVFETDFSRFDGSIHPRVRRAVELEFYGACCSDPEAVKALISREIDNPNCTTRGMAYDSLGTRLSGSPLTTDGNTLINAFVQYCANRHEGFDEEVAFKQIGPCYGDDGVTRAKHMEYVCGKLGMKIKSVERASVANPHVGFLGRIYPNIRDDLGSFQDPPRVWAKFGAVLAVEGIDPEDLMTDKIFSFSITDSGAPLLGKYCARALRVRRQVPVNARGLTRAYLSECLGLSATNTWPQVDPDNTEYRDLYARLLGIERETLEEAEAAVARATRASGLRHILPYVEDPNAGPPGAYVIGSWAGKFSPVSLRASGRTGTTVNRSTRPPTGQRSAPTRTVSSSTRPAATVNERSSPSAPLSAAPAPQGP